MHWSGQEVKAEDLNGLDWPPYILILLFGVYK